MDNQLGQSGLCPELYRPEIADGRVSAKRVEEPLDVVEHISHFGVAHAVALFADPFDLERSDEARHWVLAD